MRELHHHCDLVVIPATDQDGYLLELDDWSTQVAEIIAAEESIQLDEVHWQVIRALRDFHHRYELSPSMRPLVKWIKEQVGPEVGSSLALLKLFPGSPAKIAAKIAGLPRPPNCI